MLQQKYVVEQASLAQIANELLCSKGAVRGALVRAGIPLRGQGHAAAVAYGVRIARGRRVQDSVETRVIQAILSLRADGLSFDAIAERVSQLGVPTKTRRLKWNGGCVRTIYLRHKATC